MPGESTEEPMLEPGQSRCMIACLSLIFCLGICLAAAPAAADVYKWVDADGVVHFSDQPPESSGTDRPVEIQPDAPPSTYQPTSRPEPTSKTPDDSGPRQPDPAPKPKVKAPPKVELYVTSWCKYCKLAQAFLRRNNIPFQVYDIEKDAEAGQRRKAIDKRSGVPLAVINGQVLLGFSEANYRRALESGP